MSATPGQAERPTAPHGNALGVEPLVAEVVSEAYWQREIGSERVTWSGKVEPSFGYSRAELGNDVNWVRARVHPDDLGRVERAAREAIEGEAPAFVTEYRFRRKDGSWA